MKKETQLTSVLDIILDNKYRWFFHFIFLLVVFAEDIDYTLHNSDDKNLAYLIIIGIQLFSIYFNIYYLFKKFLITGRILKYIIYTGLCIFVYAFANVFAYLFSSLEYFFKTSENQIIPISSFDLGTLILFYSFRILSIIGTAVAIKFLKYYHLQQKNIQDLKKNSLENELLYLKNQINPHFLFNSLNNIHTLSKKNHENSSEAILLLSELLRYQLYDCSKEKVLLEDEIQYLKRFIELEGLRREKRKMTFKIQGETKDIKITPFLYIPFVENAIKFGMLAEDNSIEIEFLISNKEITFTIKNYKSLSNYPKPFGGIGLKNIKRRLELLYTNEHQLIISNSSNQYKATLILKYEKN